VSVWIYWQIGATGGKLEVRDKAEAARLALDTMQSFAAFAERCHVRVLETPALWTAAYSPRAHYVKQAGDRGWTLYAGAELEMQAPDAVEASATAA
jgi:hypothetical protein